jgi:hypothetical protein
MMVQDMTKEQRDEFDAEIYAIEYAEEIAAENKRQRLELARLQRIHAEARAARDRARQV